MSTYSDNKYGSHLSYLYQVLLMFIGSDVTVNIGMTVRYFFFRIACLNVTCVVTGVAYKTCPFYRVPEDGSFIIRKICIRLQIFCRVQVTEVLSQ
jgi:hypothetical protein